MQLGRLAVSGLHCRRTTLAVSALSLLTLMSVSTEMETPFLVSQRLDLFQFLANLYHIPYKIDHYVPVNISSYLQGLQTKMMFV